MPQVPLQHPFPREASHPPPHPPLTYTALFPGFLFKCWVSFLSPQHLSKCIHFFFLHIYVLIPWLPHRGQCQEVKNHFCFVHHFIPSPVTVTKLGMHLLKELGRTKEILQSKGQWLGPMLETKSNSSGLRPAPALSKFHSWLRCAMPYREGY